ncbi:MAG: hypothetical protein RLZZ214_66 [Verrucomicrobiota bacterium]
MPVYVFIAFAIFSLPGGLLDAWIGQERVDLLSLGLTTLAEGGCPQKSDTAPEISLRANQSQPPLKTPTTFQNQSDDKNTRPH